MSEQHTIQDGDDEVRHLRHRVEELESVLQRRPSEPSRDIQYLPGDFLLQASQLHLARTIMETMSDGLIVVDTTARVTLGNPAVRQALGDDFQSIPLKDWCAVFEICKGDGLTPLQPDQMPLARALRGETVDAAELYMRRPGGHPERDLWLNVSARPFYDDSGQCQGAFAIVRDMTSAKRYEMELKLRNRAMASSSEGITISDPSMPGNPIIYVNEGFERLTGYRRSEVIGRNCRFMQGPESDPAARLEIRSAIEEQRPCTVELLNYRKDGSTFWNRLSITPVRNVAGQVTHFIGVQSDITDRVLAERQLQQTTAELDAANRRLVRNLRTAAKVQRALLPDPQPGLPGLNVCWRLEPCEELAGDILNVLRLDDRHVGLYVLDVSGHGTAAALMSVAVSRFLQPKSTASSLVWKPAGEYGDFGATSPADVMNDLNKAFPWDPVTGQFFTILYGVVDVESRLFRYVSAGHPGPVHVPKEGAPASPRGTGLPIGIGDQAYEEQQLRLAPGDRLYLYSDGVSETMNAENVTFGEARLFECLQSLRGAGLEESLSGLLEQLAAWRGGRSVKDDVSLIGCELL